MLYYIVEYQLPLILQVKFGMMYFLFIPKICQTKIIICKINVT